MTNLVSSSQRFAPKRQRLPGASLLLLLLTGCNDAQAPATDVGSKFPLHELEQTIDLGGKGTDLGGKTLVINFWATWCSPCREEMPLLQQLNERLDPERFAVIGVSVDEDSNLVREFLLQYGIEFRTFQDREFYLASEILGIVSYPQTFVVSPQGIITRRIGQALSPDHEMIDELLGSVAGAAGQPITG